MISFSGESIAGIPLCCQQRTAPWTRREHGLPFLVRAPHVWTCSASAGVAGAFSGEDWTGRSMISGGLSRRQPRPNITPTITRTTVATRRRNQ